MSKKFVSRRQLELLPKRLRKAEETNATKELNDYMWNLYKGNSFKPLKILVVGAGGSYPAAVFAKYAISREIRTPNIDAFTPQTAIEKLTQFDYIINCDWYLKYDLVFGISYSGTTPDIKSVSELCVKKGYPFVLLTGAEKEELSEIYKESDNLKIISYFNPEDKTGKERGMLSFVATLAPIIIFDDKWSGSKLFDVYQKDLEDGKNFVASLDIPSIANGIKSCPIIHLFYDYNTMATAIDIESKITESGIGVVVLHEKKNFSHGRYSLFYNNNFSTVINLTRYSYKSSKSHGYKNEYDEKLASFLTEICKEKSAQYIEIGTPMMLLSDWNICAMTTLPYFVTAIGEEMGIDVSKPMDPISKEALKLYAYKGEF